MLQETWRKTAQKNKGRLFASSAVILLPAVAGLTFWVVHGWSGTAAALLLFPLPLLALHGVCVWMTLRDPQNGLQDKKALSMAFWLCPVLSLLFGAVWAAEALNAPSVFFQVQPFILGLLLIAVGNFLPKCRQNRTLGVKLPWTLASEENWNATHRFAGKLWVTSGAGMALAAFLPESATAAICVTGIVAAALLPVGYSYAFYRRNSKPAAPAKEKGRAGIGFAVTAAVLLGCTVLLFTGDVRFELADDALTVRATYWPEATLAYGDIESVKYMEGMAVGTRVNGFGSPRLMLGRFRNGTLGDYTRYTYAACKSAVVLEHPGGTLVLGGADEAKTRALYESVLAKLPAA